MIIKHKKNNTKLLYQDFGKIFSKSCVISDNNFYVIDKNVFNLYFKNNEKLSKVFTNQNMFLLDAKEKNKSLKTVVEIVKKMLLLKSKRNTTIVSIGGGITGDVAGFVAAIIYRGIDWINIPTTLLSQVDSCIGGKCGVNFDRIKNVLGAYHPPKEVYICKEFLKTLSKEDFFSGMGEVFKTLIISNQFSFDKGNNIIIHCLNVKKHFVEEDEFEKKGYRTILNYGHTFAHAIEKVYNNEIPHGIAVLFGIIYANIISYKLGLIDKFTKEKIENVINNKILSQTKYHIKNISCIIDTLHTDKKNTSNKIKLVLLSRKEMIIKEFLKKDIEKLLQ